MQRQNLFLNLAFTFLGGILILYVILPLASTLLGTTPRQFWMAFTDPEVMRSIGLTFGAAGIATTLALSTGVPLAYLLARRSFPGKGMIEAIITLPIIIPHTAAGVALLMVLGRYGLIGHWFEPLGITFTDSLAGVVAAMLFVGLPYLVNMSREAFALVDEELELAANSCGASSWQTFWFISLPLAGRGVFSGAVMMGARGISEFGAVVILAYHPKVVPVLVYERLQGFGLSAAQPIAGLLIIIALVVLFVIRTSFRSIKN
jgi:molybdate/tungstate transport system permease protein